MISRVYNYLKSFFGYNHEDEHPTHIFITRKRYAEAVFTDSSPSKRQCLDSNAPGCIFKASTADKDNHPLKTLSQESSYFTKPEMRRTSPVDRRATYSQGSRSYYPPLRMMSQGKENNVIDMTDEEDETPSQNAPRAATQAPATRDKHESCWVNAEPKHNPNSKRLQRPSFIEKSNSDREVNLQSRSSDSVPGSAQWHVLDPRHQRLHRGKLSIRPKRLDNKNYNPLTLTGSSIRGIEEAVRLEEKNNYSLLLRQYEAEKSKLVRTVTQPNKHSGVFSSQHTPLVSFTKAKEKIELIDLTKKCKEQMPKIRRDLEAHPLTMACEIAKGSIQSADSINRSALQLNSFENFIKFNKYYQPKFLPDTIKKFEEKKHESQKELVEPLYRAEQYARKNENHMKQIEERMMRHIKITDAEIILDDTADEEQDLPHLTPRMEKAIDAALIPNPPQETLVEAFSLKITRHDIHTLAKLNWLNDEVINYYMNLLIERGKLGTHPLVYAFNTFFYSKLMNGGHAMLKRWTRKIDLFSHDIIIVPVHLGMHWCMSAIDFRSKTIKYYDSMGNPNNKCLQGLAKYLQDESLDKKKVQFDTSDWKLINVKDNPQQMNGSDCGVFACMYAEFICRDVKITFTQANMPYFRRKMVYEILNGKLLT